VASWLDAGPEPAASRCQIPNANQRQAAQSTGVEAEFFGAVPWTCPTRFGSTARRQPGNADPNGEVAVLFDRVIRAERVFPDAAQRARYEAIPVQAVQGDRVCGFMLKNQPVSKRIGTDARREDERT
jgi:hypothetical protein